AGGWTRAGRGTRPRDHVALRVIVDVHTHTPTHRDRVPPEEAVTNTAWRPDRPVAATTTWADYARMADEASVDVSITCLIAAEPGSTGLDVDPRRVNDMTAAFVADAPTRRIGFSSVHPDAPRALEELERSAGD